MDVFLESLYHFSCPHCKKWWTVADVKMEIGEEIYCPHCGVKSAIADIKTSIISKQAEQC